ncbi:ATPase, T2SS/T4P/T4SS family [Paenibacillus thailandensis]|uniref:ATPase, T2SS/T4P/T4SS family n=1 Tax=Paenibacillus thailandensis TaxID=393250 RepID=A0ABW5QXR3_9BACL
MDYLFISIVQAMNTGHAGSMSTGHSNGAKDMLARLETMALSGAELPVQVIRQQIASAIDLIVHLSRFRDGTRRVAEICEVADVVNGEIVLNPLFRFEETGERDGCVIGALKATGNRLLHTDKLHMAGLSLQEGIDER